MTEPERQVAVEAGQTKTPERAPGHRELKPPEWFEERLATWVQRMGLNAWTIRTSYKPKLRGAEGYAEVSPTFLEAELQFRQDVLMERGDVVIVHELTHILTDEWARAVEQVIHDMVPRRLQRETRPARTRSRSSKRSPTPWCAAPNARRRSRPRSPDQRLAGSTIRAIAPSSDEGSSPCSSQVPCPSSATTG